MPMSNAQINLDRLAAQHAQKVIAKTSGDKPSDVENTVTKALGVLQENGIYACFLYLLAKEGNRGRVTIGEMLELINRLGFYWGKPDSNEAEAVLIYVSEKVTADLERMLLIKEILEQMLIYTRYGTKARG